MAKPQIETDALLRLDDVLACEMAVPVRYAPDGTTVEQFRPCDMPAQWLLVIRFDDLSGMLDEHPLCDHHLGLWQTFHLVERPHWEIARIERL